MQTVEGNSQASQNARQFKTIDEQFDEFFGFGSSDEEDDSIDELIAEIFDEKKRQKEEAERKKYDEEFKKYEAEWKREEERRAAERRARSRADIIEGYKAKGEIHRAIINEINKAVIHKCFKKAAKQLTMLIDHWEKELEIEEKLPAKEYKWPIISDEVQKFSLLRISLGQKLFAWFTENTDEVPLDSKVYFEMIPYLLQREEDLAKLFL